MTAFFKTGVPGPCCSYTLDTTPEIPTGISTPECRSRASPARPSGPASPPALPSRLWQNHTGPAQRCPTPSLPAGYHFPRKRPLRPAPQVSYLASQLSASFLPLSPSWLCPPSLGHGPLCEFISVCNVASAVCQGLETHRGQELTWSEPSEASSLTSSADSGQRPPPFLQKKCLIHPVLLPVLEVYRAEAPVTLTGDDDLSNMGTCPIFHPLT